MTERQLWSGMIGILAWTAVAQGQPAQEIVLHSFAPSPRGANPGGGLIRDAAGDLYGTAPNGGGSAGVVFKVDLAGQQTVLYSFTGGLDGGDPQSALVTDPAGDL